MIAITKRRLFCFFGKKTVIDQDWKEALKKRGIAKDLDWMQVKGDKLMSQSPSIRSYRMSVSQDVDATPVNVYFKRQLMSRGRSLIRRFWLRPSKSVVEAWGYYRLNKIGIPCPELLAIGEERHLGILISTFLVTKEIPHSQDLLSFARQDWYFKSPDLKNKIAKDIMFKLADQLRLAHDNQFFHHDIKWRNLLIQKNENDYQVYWIDSPRATSMLFRQKRGRMVDISCLARVAIDMLSPYQRMRFLIRYFGKQRKKGEVRQMIDLIDAHISRRPTRPFKKPIQAKLNVSNPDD